nr:uncharacterized protein LOC109184816 [Ipomoea batatas]
MLRYGGRISLSNPPRYLEGSVKCFAELDSDEWGMMTLKEKVYEVGYNKEDNIRLFHLTDNGLLELHTDEDACVLVNCVVRPKSVDIWVVLGVVGDDETNDGEVEISADEGEGDSDWVKGDSADELDSECEIEENGVDDFDFLKYIDENVEFGGDWGSVCDGVEEPYGTVNPKYISFELQFSGSEGEQSDGNLRCEENVEETGEGNGRESMQIGAEVPQGMNGEQIGVEVPQGMNGDQATEQLATNTVQNQLGVEVPNQEEIIIQTQPEYGSDLESIPVDIQIEHDDPANETFEIPVELVHLSSNELPGEM